MRCTDRRALSPMLQLLVVFTKNLTYGDVGTRSTLFLRAMTRILEPPPRSFPVLCACCSGYIAVAFAAAPGARKQQRVAIIVLHIYNNCLVYVSRLLGESRIASACHVTPPPPGERTIHCVASRHCCVSSCSQFSPETGTLCSCLQKKTICCQLVLARFFCRALHAHS